MEQAPKAARRRRKTAAATAANQKNGSKKRKASPTAAVTSKNKKKKKKKKNKKPSSSSSSSQPAATAEHSSPTRTQPQRTAKTTTARSTRRKQKAAAKQKAAHKAGRSWVAPRQKIKAFQAKKNENKQAAALSRGGGGGGGGKKQSSSSCQQAFSPIAWHDAGGAVVRQNVPWMQQWRQRQQQQKLPAENPPLATDSPPQSSSAPAAAIRAAAAAAAGGATPAAVTHQPLRLKQQDGATSSPNGRGPRQLIISDLFSPNQLQELDKEIYAFCAYVRLSPTERSSRQRFIERVESLAVATFGGQGKIPNLGGRFVPAKTCNEEEEDEKKTEPSAVRLQVFGSFATEAVCSYFSDIDLALWGVVPAAAAAPSSTYYQPCSSSSSKPAATATKRSQNVEGQKKETKRAKWKRALEAVDAENATTNGHNDDDDDDSNNNDNKSDEQNTKVAQKNPHDEETIIDQHVKTEANEVGLQAASQDKKDDDDVTLLFVIDRVGESAAPAADLASDGTKTQVEMDRADNKGYAAAKENETDERASAAPKKKQSEVLLSTAGESAETALYISSGDSHDMDSKDMSGATECAGYGSEDSADKLEAYHHGGSVHQPLDLVGSAAAKGMLAGSEAESDDNGRVDASNTEVSFVSRAVPAATTMVGPTGATRRLVINALNALSRKLRRSPISRSVQLIKNARVPIIKMATTPGFEIDIAIGGHNGTDTSHYAAEQIKKFESFAAVVLVLKVLLAQHSLDTPFTGGLGSYKLYVLVAYHLQQHVALGGADRPGEVLLGFLFRYGCIEGYLDHSHRTRLVQDIVVQDCDGCTADLSNVFKLSQCMQLFREGWSRLGGRMNYVVERRRRGVAEGHYYESLLAQLIDAPRLCRERQQCLEATTAPVVATVQQSNNARLSGGTAEKRGRSQDASDDSYFQSPMVRGDLSERELFAGFRWWDNLSPST